MLRTHEELAALQRHSDPLETIVGRFKIEVDVLCLDEFLVSGAIGAILLSGLMKTLFVRGTTLVVISNIPPDELYRNGLQRAHLLSVIDTIRQHCDIMSVDAGIDYRLRTLTQTHLWLPPLGSGTYEQMDKLWLALAGVPHVVTEPTLKISHRKLPTLGVESQTLVVSFVTLYVDARNQHDYIVPSRLFHTVILFGVPMMTTQLKSEARCLIALVDEFYKRHMKLVTNATVPLYDIYRGKRSGFEFQRYSLRLQEMQSEEYLRRPHMPWQNAFPQRIGSREAIPGPA